MAVRAEHRHGLDEFGHAILGRRVALRALARAERRVLAVSDEAFGGGSVGVVAGDAGRGGEVHAGVTLGQGREVMAGGALPRVTCLEQVPPAVGMGLVAGEAVLSRGVGMRPRQPGLDVRVAGCAQLLRCFPQKVPASGVVGSVARAAPPLALETVGGALPDLGLEPLVAEHAKAATATLMEDVHVGSPMGAMAPLAFPIQQRLMGRRGGRFLDDLGVAFLALGGRCGLGPSRPEAQREDRAEQKLHDGPARGGHGEAIQGDARGVSITYLSVRFDKTKPCLGLPPC